MHNSITVAVDAMGGDNAPEEIIKGAVLAVQDEKDIKVILTGVKHIQKELVKYTLIKSIIGSCAEVITI